MCNRNCNKLCPNLIFSDSITIVDDTLVIDIPGLAASYYNCRKLCLVLTEALPDAATIVTPVAISIGGITTTLYPLVDCNGVQLTAAQLSTRYKYKVKVATNATAGVFKVYNLPCQNTTGVLETLGGQEVNYE